MNDPALGRALLRLGYRAIELGLDRANAPPPRACLRTTEDETPAALGRPGACFVTLRKSGKLRGCIGNLESEEPLLENVVTNAYRAAFHDPRFPPLAREELNGLELHVSVIGPMEPVTFRDEAELITKLRPGIDGLVIRAGSCQATFLPAVWKQLPEADAFLRELKQKAELPPRPLTSERLQAWRYAVRSFPGD